MTDKHWCRWDEHDCEAAYEEIERLREQAVEDQRLSFSWMAKHDRLLGFIQKRPAMLKELIEEDRALEPKP